VTAASANSACVAAAGTCGCVRIRPARAHAELRSRLRGCALDRRRGAPAGIGLDA
jgi:hypothetical protein